MSAPSQSLVALEGKQIIGTDPSSCANHDAARVTQFHLDATLNFDNSQEALHGIVTLSVLAEKDDPNVVILDTRGLNASDPNANLVVNTITINEETTPFVLGLTTNLGTPLVVQLPTLKKGDTVDVKITYRVSLKADGSAAQLLGPEKTASKKLSYFYTQCQAIFCRSILPCQDSPGVKTPYTANLTVPTGYTAIMSAHSKGSTENTANGTTTFHFDQPNPIPSYLFAILVGEIEYVKLSDRVGIWTEPAYMETCKEEFSELEDSLRIIESICGPYRWGTYDLVNLVGAFPYGGMENPQITFTSPSLLPLPRENLYNCPCRNGSTGKAGLNVCIHEQVHSWSGNLVTNSTWESFFLNEGLTVFIERRVLKILREEREGKIGYESLHRIIGWNDLQTAVDEMSASDDKNKTSALVLNLQNNVDPDEVYSIVSYEKGFALMCYLEHIAGGREVFHAFLKAYFTEFAFKTIDAEGFKAFYTQWVTKYHEDNNTGYDITSKLAEIDWQKWYHQEGMPEYQPEINDVLSKNINELADALVQHSEANTLPQLLIDGGKYTPATVDLHQWSPSQLVVFLDKLTSTFDHSNQANDAREQYQARWRQLLLFIQEHYFPFNTHGYSEVLFRWLTLQIRTAFPLDFIASQIECDSDAKETKTATLADTIRWFLSEIGRMKFVLPLYRDMKQSIVYQQYAIDLFNDRKSHYHPICALMVDRIMHSNLSHKY